MPAPIRHAPTVLIIHGNRQDFVDDLLIESEHAITRVFHPPRKTGMGWDMGQVPAP